MVIYQIRRNDSDEVAALIAGVLYRCRALADDHQPANAKYLTDVGAGLMLTGTRMQNAGDK
jgi:UDP-N-acetylglucosamine:LPS N-acetylglucosamine transferase